MQDLHTYLVGGDRWAVHNCGGGYQSTYPRHVQSGQDLPDELVDNLSQNPAQGSAGRTRSFRPTEGPPNSFTNVGPEHVMIFDENGYAAFDVSRQRVQPLHVNIDSNGIPHVNSPSGPAAHITPVPQHWIDVLGL